MMRMVLAFRDAQGAYLQVVLEMPGDVITLVELPREFRPPSWFRADGSPKFRRPLAIIAYALPGHPKSGFLWECHLDERLLKLGWNKIPDWGGLCWHPRDRSVLVIYVDDLMMAAISKAVERHWADIGVEVTFDKDAALVERYLGGNYTVTAPCSKDENLTREISVDMASYLLN